MIRPARSSPPAALTFAAALLVSLGASLGASVGVAHADMSSKVISTFRGQLVISKDELPAGKNDAATIVAIKAARLKELTGSANSEDVTTWKFHYTAFLSKTGSAVLKLEFYVDDKDKRYVADQRLEGIDPKSAVLSGEIVINEDEGLAKGKSYILKLVTDKDVVVATTPITMK
jgi:hypothetical protein